MKDNLFCNNCGKTGHIYQKCRKPIISLGIIAVRYNPHIEYLLIRRRNTLGYVDFIRGKYTLASNDYIQQLFNIMTTDEIESLKTKSFDYLWKVLWGHNESQYHNEYSTSQQKFNQLKTSYQYNIDYYDKNRTTIWTEPEWGFPKGRRNYLEIDIKCAIREWEEETGYNKDTINTIMNITPLNEIFIGTNNKSYKYKYYIAIMKDIIDIPTNYEVNEISMVKWASYAEAVKLFRFYNVEKIDLLKRLDTLLKNNNIYQ